MRALAFLLLCLAALPARAAGRGDYLPLILREAARSGVPPEIADAVAMVETGYRADAIGTSGEIGIMQVMPATARQLGFAGTQEELASPGTNIALGVAYLARAWAASGGDICRALMKYRAGLGEELMTPLSGQYCARAVGWLRGGSSLLATGTALPAPDPHVVSLAPMLSVTPVLSVAPMLSVAPALPMAPSLPAAPALSMAPSLAPADPAPRRSMAERGAALQARYDSHRRHLEARVAAAIAVAADEE